MISDFAHEFVVNKRVSKVDIYVRPLSARMNRALNYQIGIEALTFAPVLEPQLC